MYYSSCSLLNLIQEEMVQLRQRWIEQHSPDGWEADPFLFEETEAQIKAAAERGDFQEVRKIVNQARSVIGVFPPLDSLHAACELAVRISSFVTIPWPGMGRSLASSCKEDLEALAILADWLAEQELPLAAEEARRLLGMVRGHPREPVLRERIPTPEEWWDHAIMLSEMDME